MKKLFAKLFIFSLPLIGLNLYFYTLINDIYITDYQVHKPNFRKYLLADSHGRPLDNFLEKYGVYNFSGAGDAYSDMLRKLRYLIRNTQIDTLIITVDHHNISTYRTKKNNKEASHSFSDYADYSSYFFAIKEKVFRHYIVFLNIKSRTILREHILSTIKGLLSKEKKSAKDWKDLNATESKALIDKRIEELFLYEKYAEILVADLQEIVKICKQNNIFLIGIKFPVPQAFKVVSAQYTYAADTVLTAQRFPVYDFSDIFATQDSLFYDQDHLKKDGGAQFADTLASFLKLSAGK